MFYKSSMMIKATAYEMTTKCKPLECLFCCLVLKTYHIFSPRSQRSVRNPLYVNLFKMFRKYECRWYWTSSKNNWRQLLPVQSKEFQDDLDNPNVRVLQIDYAMAYSCKNQPRGIWGTVDQGWYKFIYKCFLP